MWRGRGLGRSVEVGVMMLDGGEENGRGEEDGCLFIRSIGM